MTSRTDKKKILTVGFSDNEKQILDASNAGRFDITHESNTKDGLESISNATVFDALFVKDGAWPAIEGRSAIDGRDLLKQMSEIPKLLTIAIEDSMFIGIAHPECGKKPVVQNLKDLESIRNVERITALDISTNKDLKALFSTVVENIINEESLVKEDSAGKTEDVKNAAFLTS
ncbi:MAG: hypothetical protein QGG63_01265 [Candidatus Pacebacteria bacterium]|jgi:glutaredoxin-related protein|nr:hypothetical protein [Candidatus Paceibacterota bacterium]|tara:strand:+ start:33991 stop:34512 length:522 start_codon:yes stop_codon:yes gene_type:complete